MPVRNSLTGALPQLLTAERALHAAANALGIDYRIADFGGVRTYADTVLIMGYRAADYAAAVAANPSIASVAINEWRPIADFGTSRHNYGGAFDILITKTPQGMTTSAALAKLKSLAPSVGLRSNVPNDPPHFELPISFDELRRLWGKSPGVIDSTTATVSAAVVLGLFLLLAGMRRRRGR